MIKGINITAVEMSHVHSLYTESQSHISHRCLRAGLSRYLPEKGLHVYNRFGICHVVFLGTHGAFFVHNHHVGSESHSTPE